MSQPITIEDIYKLFEKTNERFEQSRQEYDPVANTNRAVEALTTRWGRFVEELVEPAVIQLFRSRGIDVKEIYSRARVKRQGIAMEIDILAVDETEVVLVECKSRLSKDDVNEFLEKLSKFKQAFPHYQNFNAWGG